MTVIQTNQAPKAIGPYVQGRIANGFLFASGQVPLDAVTGEVVGSTIEEQTTQVLK
ncbi:MAG TPA: Rid family hydrolase, partial [Enterococcus aquimarinus]|nr:Rid family hydrolase [Enterococcus aquimarinus]